jgi:hypothetical protein
MNKKILLIVTALVAVSMLVIPTVSACTYRRGRIKCMDYTAVLKPGPNPGPLPGYPKYWPSVEDPKIITSKFPPSHLNFKIVIGEDKYIEQAGDFTYDGYLLTVLIVEKNSFISTYKWTITFNEAETGIDGTLEMWLIVKYTVPFSNPFDFEWSSGGGFGTGDLRGVFINAASGTSIISDPDLGMPCVYHEGTVYNWPNWL